jgi:hypothetical protein
MLGSAKRDVDLTGRPIEFCDLVPSRPDGDIAGYVEKQTLEIASQLAVLKERDWSVDENEIDLGTLGEAEEIGRRIGRCEGGDPRADASLREIRMGGGELCARRVELALGSLADSDPRETSKNQLMRPAGVSEESAEQSQFGQPRRIADSGEDGPIGPLDVARSAAGAQGWKIRWEAWNDQLMEHLGLREALELVRSEFAEMPAALSRANPRADSL